MADTTSRFAGRIERLADEAATTRAEIDPGEPDEERAMSLLREGLGPTVSLYCEARTGDSMDRFSKAEFDRLEDAVDDWLAAYAACYGVEIEADYSVRAAAELLVETRNVRDVAQLLTGVPER
jgi:hypothetical protein